MRRERKEIGRKGGREEGVETKEEENYVTKPPIFPRYFHTLDS